jgi:hypothetical protein
MVELNELSDCLFRGNIELTEMSDTLKLTWGEHEAVLVKQSEVDVQDELKKLLVHSVEQMNTFKQNVQGKTALYSFHHSKWYVFLYILFCYFSKICLYVFLMWQAIGCCCLQSGYLYYLVLERKLGQEKLSVSFAEVLNVVAFICTGKLG